MKIRWVKLCSVNMKEKHAGFVDDVQIFWLWGIWNNETKVRDYRMRRDGYTEIWYGSLEELKSLAENLLENK